MGDRSELAIVNLLFSILLTGFGSVGLARQVRELIRALSSRRWPKGAAVVVAAAVHERRGSRGRTLFEPTIEFRYTFRGHERTGHRVAFGDVASGSRANAEALTKRFAVGTRWEVSVCERCPELAVLNPGSNGQLWLSVAFFAVYTLLATAFFLETVSLSLVGR